jgi:hypothetical protein
LGYQIEYCLRTTGSCNINCECWGVGYGDIFTRRGRLIVYIFIYSLYNAN